MRDQVHVCQDSEALACHVRDWLANTIERHMLESSKPFSIALAGGSTPKRLYQLLSELPSGRIDWSRVVLLWGDERNVAQDHADSNYRMVKESLLDRISIPASNVLAVPNPGGDPVAAASNYESLLRERLTVGKEKFPRINFVMLGMGEDVHTASLFPGTAALKENKKLVVANHVPKLNCSRITMTAPFINAAHNVGFLFAGASKTEGLSALWHAPQQHDLLPAQLVRPKDGTLWYFLDKLAMGDVPLPESMMAQLI